MTIPYRVRYFFQCAGNWRDLCSAAPFVMRHDLRVTRRARISFVKQIYRISYHVWCAHTQAGILAVARMVLRVPPEVEGVIVEAGCYKGGSTAKLSVVAKLADRRLVAFDPFEARDGRVASRKAGPHRQGATAEARSTARTMYPSTQSCPSRDPDENRETASQCLCDRISGDRAKRWLKKCRRR